MVSHEYDPSSRVTWYENPDGDPRGLWIEHVIGVGATPIHSLDVADIDGDGDVDVVAGEHRLIDEGIDEGRAWVFENLGGGERWIAHEIDDADAHHDGTQLADLDNDGDLDVFSVGWLHNRVLVYENTGGTDTLAPDVYGLAVDVAETTATLTFSTDEPAGASATASAAGAGPVVVSGAPGLRNDHQIVFAGLACATVYDVELDVVDAGGRSGTVDGGRFTTADCTGVAPLFDAFVIDAARPERATSMFAGDVDGDGDADLVLGAWWYEHPGDVTAPWTRHVIGAPLTDVGALHDFDGDGDLDVWGVEMGTPTPSVDAIAAHWARNDGAGNFEIFSNIDPIDGNFLQGTHVGVLEPGGPLTMAVSWQDRTRGTQLFEIPADPATQTWTWTTISTTSFGEAVAGGDIDSDGDVDFHLGEAWLENTDTGWVAHTVDAVGLTYGPDRVVLADVDGDGDLDAVVGESTRNRPANVVWYENDGDPTAEWAGGRSRPRCEGEGSASVLPTTTATAMSTSSWANTATNSQPNRSGCCVSTTAATARCGPRPCWLPPDRITTARWCSISTAMVTSTLPARAGSTRGSRSTSTTRRSDPANPPRLRGTCR